jgi:hypothetical protein
MWKKIAITGTVAAAILGTGAVALAATGSTTSTAPAPSTSASTPASPKAKGDHPGAKLALRRLEHGEWVTQTKTGELTHEAIGGLVTAVSPTSISVTAADKTAGSFVVNSDTKVHVRTPGTTTGTTGSITSVKVGDRVVVSGTKSGSTVTAAQIVDAGTPKTK